MTDTLDLKAQETAALLEGFVDRMEAHTKRNYRPAPPVQRRAPCADSSLDFLTYENGTKTISARVGRNRRKLFSKQLALCARCTIQEACLERAETYKIKIGIWGGKLPHERGWKK